MRTARIGQPQGLGDLVEGFAGGVVDGCAHAPAAADALDGDQLAMAAGDQQQQEGVVDVAVEPGRDRVALQVVDGDERQAPGQGDGLAEGQADHHPADEARSGGSGDAAQVGEAEAGLRHRLGDDRIDDLDMGPGGDFRHHAAERGVGGDLAGDDVGQHLDPAGLIAAHHRGGGFVAAGLEAKDSEGEHRLRRFRRSCSTRP